MRHQRQQRGIHLSGWIPCELGCSLGVTFSNRRTGRCGGESGVEVGEGVALDLAVGFFSGAELGDGAHFA